MFKFNPEIYAKTNVFLLVFTYISLWLRFLHGLNVGTFTDFSVLKMKKF